MLTDFESVSFGHFFDHFAGAGEKAFTGKLLEIVQFHCFEKSNTVKHLWGVTLLRESGQNYEAHGHVAPLIIVHGGL